MTYRKNAGGLVKKFIATLFSFEGAGPAVGVNDGEGPPVPIPNTEVKLTGAENTCLATDWENRAMPTQRNAVSNETAFFFCIDRNSRPNRAAVLHFLPGCTAAVINLRRQMLFTFALQFLTSLLRAFTHLLQELDS